MRSLKFRAWKMNNGKLQRYIFDPFAWSRYANNHLDEPIKFDSTTNDIRNFMPDADIIEQCTGLKDKNGKEIYEGDILQDESNDAAVVIWREHQAEWGIKWIHMGIEDSLSHRMEWGHLNEIIGNIHENPELLKKEK